MERNSGNMLKKSNFELLRILAMFGIIIFHHFGNRVICQFAVLPNGFSIDKYFYDVINNTTKSFDFRTLLLDFCYGHFGNGGNFLFMLITGYFMFGKSLNYEKNIKSIKKILFMLLFWGFVLTAVYGIVIKVFYPIGDVSSYKPIFLLPNWLSGSNMWYFQAYGIFILIVVPILKRFENRIDRNIHKKIIAVLVCLFFLDFSKYLPSIWLSERVLQFVTCYYIGGYISRYSISVSWKSLWLALMSYMAVYFAYEYYWRMGMRKMYNPSEYSYISVMQPFICCLIYAVIIFLMFSKLNFSSRAVNHVAAATPGIYIFHFNMISLCFAFANTYWWKNWTISGYIAFVIVDTIILFGVGCIIDNIRMKIFAFVKSRVERCMTESTHQ